jgi:hypothetical protein
VAGPQLMAGNALGRLGPPVQRWPDLLCGQSLHLVAGHVDTGMMFVNKKLVRSGRVAGPG